MTKVHHRLALLLPLLGIGVLVYLLQSGDSQPSEGDSRPKAQQITEDSQSIELEEGSRAGSRSGQANTVDRLRPRISVEFSDGESADLDCMFFVFEGDVLPPGAVLPQERVVEVVGATDTGYPVREQLVVSEGEVLVKICGYVDVKFSVLGEAPPDKSIPVWSARKGGRPQYSDGAKVAADWIREVYSLSQEDSGMASELWRSLVAGRVLEFAPVVAGEVGVSRALRIPNYADGIFFYLPTRPSNVDFLKQPIGAQQGEPGRTRVLANVDMYQSQSSDFFLDDEAVVDIQLLAWTDASIVGTLDGIQFGGPASFGISYIDIKHVEEREGVVRSEGEKMVKNEGSGFFIDGLRPGEKRVTATHYLDQNHVCVYSATTGQIPSGGLWDVGALSVDPWRVEIAVSLSGSDGAALSGDVLEKLEACRLGVIPFWQGGDGRAFAREMNVPLAETLILDGLGAGALEVIPDSEDFEDEDGNRYRFRPSYSEGSHRVRPTGEAQWSIEIPYRVSIKPAKNRR